MSSADAATTPPTPAGTQPPWRFSPSGRDGTTTTTATPQLLVKATRGGSSTSPTSGCAASALSAWCTTCAFDQRSHEHRLSPRRRKRRYATGLRRIRARLNRVGLDHGAGERDAEDRSRA